MQMRANWFDPEHKRVQNVYVQFNIIWFKRVVQSCSISTDKKIQYIGYIHTYIFNIIFQL